jgi:hypothetical protein
VSLSDELDEPSPLRAEKTRDSGESDTPTSDVEVLSSPNNNGVPLSGDGTPSAPVRRGTKIATVSHTLDAEVAERLRHFAFHERISESAVIEFALRELFAAGDESALGARLRLAGAALRRKT